MRRSYHWLTTVIVAWGAAGLAAAHAAPAGAEQPPAPAPPAAPITEPAAAQEALTSSEDVAVLKALAPLGLTRTQLSELLPALQGTQAKLAELDAKEAAKLAAWRSSLEQARRDLLAGKGNGARASDQFALAQWGSAQKRASLRADLISTLQATLEKVLTPAQAAQVAQSGQVALFAQRTAGWRGGGGWGGPGGPGGGPGGLGGGPGGGPGGPGGRGGGRGGGGGPGGQLDQVRLMSPADFQQYAQRRSGRMGGESSPQFQQYMTFMSQVRDMPQSQYLLQRDQLALQSLGQGRRGFGAGLAGNEQDATRAFVDRYLLNPRAPIVVRDRLQSK